MTILEILEAHKSYRTYIDRDDMAKVSCSCGEKDIRRAGMLADGSHRAHVADVLEEHMQSVVEKAQANTLIGVANEWEKFSSPGAHHLYDRMLRQAVNQLGVVNNGGVGLHG